MTQNHVEATRDKMIEAIARRECDVETLETRGNDSLDFHDISVWELRKALEAAYEAGRAYRDPKIG